MNGSRLSDVFSFDFYSYVFLIDLEQDEQANEIVSYSPLQLKPAYVSIDALSAACCLRNNVLIKLITCA